MHPIEAADSYPENRRDADKVTPGQIILGAGVMIVGTLIIYTALGVFILRRALVHLFAPSLTGDTLK